MSSIKELQEKIQIIKQVVFDAHVLLPSSCDMMVSIENIDFLIFEEFCKESKLEIQHPEINSENPLLLAFYPLEHGKIILGSVPVEIEITYTRKKQ